MVEKTPGQIAYEASGIFLFSAYREDHETWDCQLPGVQGHWQAAANAIIELCAEKIRERRLAEGNTDFEFDEGWESGTIDAEDAIRSLKQDIPNV